MKPEIEHAIKFGKVILFLGAGASIGSTNSQKESPPLGEKLAELIAMRAGWNYEGEPLGVVYSAAKQQLGQAELDKLLAVHFRNCHPSNEHKVISRFPWARIYTTNIDDAMESALHQLSKQKLNIKNRDDHIEDKDQLFNRLEYIYLNGSIKNPSNGFVFSPEEFGKASASQPKWYEELASDFLQCTFIFIGTNLNEPVFFHQIERYKEKAGLKAPKSYIISPKASPIQIASFQSYGLEYIQGTTTDFTSWLNSTFKETPEPLQIAQNCLPELKSVLNTVSETSRIRKVELLKSVLSVSRQGLTGGITKKSHGTIRAFYKGFKPTWQDILDEVPAKLHQHSEFIELLQNPLTQPKLIALIGPAGSGKSTIMKMAALEISDLGERVYFITSINTEFKEVINELELSNDSKFYVFIERLDPIKHEIKEILEKSRNAIIVGAESKNIWHSRIELKIEGIKTSQFTLDEISEIDVPEILEKIRLFGPWTRLGNLSEKERKKELYERSKRQLLIGLMEVTTGVGFEQIIQREYESITSDEDKLFFVMVCIATLHKCDLTTSILSRSITSLGIKLSPAAIASKLMGIIIERDGSYIARHSIYARKVIESVVDRALISSAIESLLNSFKVYTHPVVKNLTRNDAMLFKSIINHKFLADVFRGDKLQIFSIYSKFEKSLENDGLFWLQYGLAKRDFKEQPDALDLLQTAYNAYPHDHTAHALAQQKLILATSPSLTLEQAKAHLSEAITMLGKLDQILESDDTYPIVTLAEGHVAALRLLDSEANARVKAKEYFDILEKRFRTLVTPRLTNAKDKLFKFASTGVWTNKGDEENLF